MSENRFSQCRAQGRRRINKKPRFDSFLWRGQSVLSLRSKKKKSTTVSTHTSCGAQGQMVHLLGDRAHHAGRLHGHSVVHGWRDHCTLVETEEKWPVFSLHTRVLNTTEAHCLHGIKNKNLFIMRSISGNVQSDADINNHV